MTLPFALIAPTIVLAVLICPLRGAARTGHPSGAARHIQEPQPADPLVTAGRKVYEQQKCSSCHQIAKRGNSRFPLDGVGSKLTAAQLRRWMTDTAEMEAALPRLPAIRMSEMRFRLNARDLDALVAYLASLK
jgi:cbb3-type cytochrome oxidase cytochrome c subunit